MEGIKFTVDLTGDKHLLKTLNQMIKTGENLEPAFAEIGDYLIESHEERLKMGVEPDGSLMEPLDPLTIVKKGHDDILRDKDHLLNDFFYQTELNGLFFSNRQNDYVNTHQFGREADGIPARPFIGLATGQWSDADQIVNILKGHLLD